mgnify:CR=1 FL=1
MDNADQLETHNSTNSQWKRNSSKQDTISTLSNDFLTCVSETRQTTMDYRKNERQGQHYNLQEKIGCLKFPVKISKKDDCHELIEFWTKIKLEGSQ